MKNIRRIIEACDTTDYEYSYKYKKAALEELNNLEIGLQKIEDELNHSISTARGTKYLHSCTREALEILKEIKNEN